MAPIDLDQVARDDSLLRLFGEDLLRSLKAVPFATEGDVLVVAVANPKDWRLHADLEFVAARRVRLVAATPESIERVLSALPPPTIY